jgi:quinol monooxygenase YgiN
MAEVCTLDWHIAPFRADRWLDIWEPAAARMPAFGAKSWSLTRSIDDPLAFQQTSVWESRADFERYWYSEEIEAARAAAIDLYDLPILPTWHTLVAAES